MKKFSKKTKIWLSLGVAASLSAIVIGTAVGVTQRGQTTTVASQEQVSHNQEGLFKQTYNTKTGTDQTAADVAKQLNDNPEALKTYIDWPTGLDANWNFALKATPDNSKGTITVVLTQLYSDQQLPEQIRFTITGFKVTTLTPVVNDAAELFDASYKVAVTKANELASTAVKELTSYDVLQAYVDANAGLPAVPDGFEFQLATVTANDVTGTVSVVINQSYDKQAIELNQISFTLTGFVLSAADLFTTDSYAVTQDETHNIEFVSDVAKNLTATDLSYADLKQYIDLPDNADAATLKFNSTATAKPDNSVDVTLTVNQKLATQTATPINFKITGFYDYQTVTQAWVPANNQLIRNSGIDLTDKQAFSKFIVDHWNTSLAYDTLNAIRWVYTDKVDKLNTVMQSYIDASVSQRLSIGYLMGSVPTDPNPDAAKKLSDSKTLFNPKYSSSIKLENNDMLNLNFEWSQKNYQEYFLTNSKIPYWSSFNANVSGNLNFSIKIGGPEYKPTTNVSGTISASIKNAGYEGTEKKPVPGWTSESNLVPDKNGYSINISDALYYYYNQNNSEVEDSIFNNNLYSVFKDLFSKVSSLAKHSTERGIYNYSNLE